MRRAIAGAVLLLTVACRPEGVSLVPGSNLPADVYGSPRPTPSPSPQEIPRRGTVFLVRNGRLHPQTAQLQGTAGSIQEALWIALISEEPDRPSVTTEIPSGTVLNDIEVDDLVVTVDLSSTFEQGGPPESLDLRIAQVVFTLTQPQSGVTAVRFEIDGEPEAVVRPDHPVSRGSFGEFAPQGSS
jgi:hypothetical protein